MKRLELILLLAATSFLMTFTKADPELSEANKETEVKAEENEKQMKNILQKQLEDNAKGDTDWEKLIATLSVTVAQLEMENHKRDEETKMEKRKTKREMQETKMEMQETKMEMRKTKREMGKKMAENEKEIKNLRAQMKKKDNNIRQLDERITGPGGPVSPLEKFLQQTESKITNHTKRIVKLEDAFCGKCERPYGKKFIPLLPYLGSHYDVYPEYQIWDTAHAACVNRLKQTESGEWRHVWTELKAKDPNNYHWLGAQKLGGGGPKEGFIWLAGGTISGENFAWSDNPGNFVGKCLNTQPTSIAVDNNWYAPTCLDTNRPLCEFKN